jgi:hypothetical protein
MPKEKGKKVEIAGRKRGWKNYVLFPFSIRP